MQDNMETNLYTVASKCGFDVFGVGGVTNSAAHIESYIDGTIERLGFTPDLYYLHRIDPSKSPFGRLTHVVHFSNVIPYRDTFGGVYSCPR
jgi:aryl-alcohol dehydrogenase-like predicted oxidoreductase